MVVLVRVALLACLAYPLSACGGSGGEAKSPSETGDGSSTNSGWSGPGEDGTSSSQGPDCSDGTCFTCGEGICPTGAYCDQGAQGGSACAWLPECSGAPSCECIKKVLSGCSCDDSTGGPVVSCN